MCQYLPTSWRPIIVALVAALACMVLVPAHAAGKYEGKTVEQLDQMLVRVITRGKQFKILGRLKLIGESIVRRGECRTAWQDARQTRRSLVDLNSRYRGRADNNYRDQEIALRQKNRTALQNYRNCFSREIKTHHLWKEQNIVDYRTFHKLFMILAVELEGQNETDLRRDADEIYAARQRLAAVSKFPLAALTGISGSVKVTRKNRLVRVAQGINILGGDTIRTAGDGQVKIEFTEVRVRSRRGLSYLLIGPNTKVSIGHDANMVVQKNGRGPIRLNLNLAFGSLRVINTGTGHKSQYLVGAGAETVRLPGGDAIVSYYPKRAFLNLKLRSGVAEIDQVNSPAVRLQPNTQISVRGGQLQRVYKLREQHWNAAVRASGDPGNWAQRGRNRKPSPRASRSVNRHDILRRAASREAVDRMLISLRDIDSEGLLAATSGAANDNARRSIRGGSSLQQVLNRTGRPSSWRTDCVACQSDGVCVVPTVVSLSDSRGYEALHVVKPARNGGYYLVDRIDQWDTAAQRRFRARSPLCQAQIKR